MDGHSHNKPSQEVIMKKLFLFVPVIGILAFVLVSCQEETPMEAPMNTDTGVSSLGKTGRTVIWADGFLYRSVVTPATFKGNGHAYDQLYAGSFKDGIALISESKPGDKDYNGGRWHLNVLKEGLGSKYLNASADTDLDISDFEATGNYFECPLQPMK